MAGFWHHLFERLQAIDDTPLDWLLQALAAPLAWLYGLGALSRRAWYARGWLPVKRLPAPVVSVGNLTVGGTGKTPVTAALARLFQAQGRRVAILSRGYGGRARCVTRLSDGERIYFQPPEVGEEAYWLARTLPGAAVYTAPRRCDAGMAAWREFQPDVFLLDDGFQHYQLHRDLDIVLLDAGAPWGNGRVLPRGPLREPLSVLAAAHLFILTRFQAARHQEVLQQIKAAFPDKPVLTAVITPVGVRSYPGGEAAPLASLANRRLYSFAGLARPGVFIATLSELGVDRRGGRAFPDHHAYSAADLRLLLAAARQAGAQALITTAKDWARLGEKWEADLPLWVLEVAARLDQPEVIFSLLNRRAR